MKSCCARYAASLVTASPGPSPVVSSVSRIKVFPIFNPTHIRRAKMSTSSPRYTAIPKELPGDEPDDVLFGSVYGVRTIELNRPKKLNSLNGSMIRKILPRLREWEKSQMANIVMISGAGEKAFCAGGDVTALAKQNSTSEGQKESSDYFGLEYQLDQLIATYSKPYIAVMDGITMGGGVGLSVHAPFRIATEKTVFAMPETTIGFFPDVGGSFFLPRLDGEIGTYLALTSERLHGVQAFYAGIATHYIDSSVLGALTTRLSELVFKDYATLPQRLQLINSTLSEFTSGLPSPDSYEKSKYGNISGRLRRAIDDCFKYDDISDILSHLEQESINSKSEMVREWAKATASTIAARSPTSLKVTLRQLRIGKQWNISETFVREHQIATRFMSHPDFVEGVGARLISKPPQTPKWQPETLDAVTTKDVDSFFASQPGVAELKFLEPVAGAPDAKYTEYPHANLALPSEREIEEIVVAKGEDGPKAVLGEVMNRWQDKLGVKEKVADILERKAIVSNKGKKVRLRSAKTNL